MKLTRKEELIKGMNKQLDKHNTYANDIARLQIEAYRVLSSYKPIEPCYSMVYWGGNSRWALLIVFKVYDTVWSPTLVLLDDMASPDFDDFMLNEIAWVVEGKIAALEGIDDGVKGAGQVGGPYVSHGSLLGAGLSIQSGSAPTPMYYDEAAAITPGNDIWATQPATPEVSPYRVRHITIQEGVTREPGEIPDAPEDTRGYLYTSSPTPINSIVFNSANAQFQQAMRETELNRAYSQPRAVASPGVSVADDSLDFNTRNFTVSASSIFPD